MTPRELGARLAAALLILLVVSACAGESRPATVTPKPQQGERIVFSGHGGAVFRVTDEEAGVVCWVYIGYQKGGISCLPRGDTRLGK